MRRGAQVTCPPIHGDLYLVFSKIKAPEGLLGFIKKHGLLTGNEPHYELDDPELMLASGPYQGDSVYECLKKAQFFNELLRHKIRGRRKIKPHTLIHALRWQVGLTLAGDAKIRECRYCGEWFKAGYGPVRLGREDATFCTHEHQVLFNN
jgi:hypothetical protein